MSATNLTAPKTLPSEATKEVVTPFTELATVSRTVDQAGYELDSMREFLRDSEEYLSEAESSLEKSREAIDRMGRKIWNDNYDPRYMSRDQWDAEYDNHLIEELAVELPQKAA